MNNKETLQTYENGLDAYVELTPSEMGNEFGLFWENQLKRFDSDSNILEIGTATGRTADYIESLGYSVDRSDAAHAFVDYQKSLGKDAQLVDILDIQVEKQYDLVIAEAVVLHLTDDNFLQALSGVRETLMKDGVFIFTFKSGEGEEVSTHKMNAPRYFNYWSENEMNDIVKRSGFKVLESGFFEKAHKWLYVTAQKTQI